MVRLRRFCVGEDRGGGRAGADRGLAGPRCRSAPGGGFCVGGNGSGAHAAVPALVEALRGPDHLTWAAASALGQIGPGAVPALIEALRDPDVKCARGQPALGRHGGRHGRAGASEDLAGPRSPGGFSGRHRAEAVPALIEALRDPGVEVRQGAALALGQIGPGVEAATAIPELIKVFNDRSHIARQNAASALASNARALQDTRATDMIGPLQAALAALTGHSEPFPRVQEHAATVKRAVDYLELLWWHHLYAQFRQGVRDHLYLVVGLVSLLYPIPYLPALLLAPPALALPGQRGPEAVRGRDPARMAGGPETPPPLRRPCRVLSVQPPRARRLGDPAPPNRPCRI